MEMTFGRKSSSCSMSEGVMCALTGTDRFSRIMNKAPDVPGETHGNKGRRNPRGLGHSQGIRAAKKFSYAEEIRSERGAVDSQDSLGFHGHFRADLACAVFPASKRAGGDAKLPRHIGGGEAVRLPISP